MTNSSERFRTSLERAKGLDTSVHQRDMSDGGHRARPTGQALPEEAESRFGALPKDQSQNQPQRRRADLMIWMGIGGGMALLGSAAVINGGIGVLDALWKMVMGGIVGIVYSWESRPTGKGMPSWGDAQDGSSSTDKINEPHGGPYSDVTFLPQKLRKLLRGEWPSKQTASMFLVGACLTAIIAEGIIPIADLGNSALVTIPSVLTGAMLGGIGYALDRVPSQIKRIGGGTTRSPTGGSPLERSVQPVPSWESGEMSDM